MELVSSGRTTIVITTHYIEEARQANFVNDNNSKENYCDHHHCIDYRWG